MATVMAIDERTICTNGPAANLESTAAIEAERLRIRAEYRRRRESLPSDFHSSWRVGGLLAREEYYLKAAMLLRRAGKFPKRGAACLEIGFGRLGWLGTLINWHLCETDLHGLELNEEDVAYAHNALPLADLRVGDAAQMPWPTGTFQLVITSTVFSSILSAEVRRAVAAEICRVLAPGGALLLADFRFNNPRNPNVRKVTRRDVSDLFPTLRGEVTSAILAPPLACRLARRSVLLVQLLGSIPFLRTHLLAVLVKPGEA